MTDADSSKGPFNFGKLFIFLLLFIIFLGVLSLIGIAGYRMGVSQPQITNNPTATPETIISPASTVPPQITTAVTAVPSLPASTLIPSPTLTITPSNTPVPTPTAVPKVDLFISEYSFNHPPKQGEPFTVKIGLYNKGTKTASSFWWEWWATSAIRPCRKKIDSLTAKGGIIVNCTYTYQGWGTFATKAVIDADNEVAESNENNNTQAQNIVPIQF